MFVGVGVWKSIRLPVGCRVLFDVGNGRRLCFWLDSWRVLFQPLKEACVGKVRRG